MEAYSFEAEARSQCPHPDLIEASIHPLFPQQLGGRGPCIPQDIARYVTTIRSSQTVQVDQFFSSPKTKRIKFNNREEIAPSIFQSVVSNAQQVYGSYAMCTRGHFD